MGHSNKDPNLETAREGLQQMIATWSATARETGIGYGCYTERCLSELQALYGAGGIESVHELEERVAAIVARYANANTP